MDVNGLRCQHGRVGPLLCLLSAAGFGAMAIFGKLAYDAGVELGDLLLVRFALAAAVLLAVAWATGALRGLPRRPVLAALGMGAIGYATQAGLYFAALERMDASLLALVLYAYPALVLVAAVALGRERATRAARRRAARRARRHRARARRRGERDARPARHGDGLRRGARLHGLHPHRRPRRRRRAAGRARRARVHRARRARSRGAVVRGGPELGFGADGWGWLGAIALVCTVGAILRSSRASRGWGRRRRRSSRRSSRSSRSASRRRRSGRRSARCSCAGGALVLSAVVVMQWPGGPAAGLRARAGGAGERQRRAMSRWHGTLTLWSTARCGRPLAGMPILAARLRRRRPTPLRVALAVERSR